MTWSAIGLALVAFVLMEPITAATHRWVMHGIGDALHRSHHQRTAARWERNDWFPIVFAALVISGFVVGFNADGFGALIPVGVGVTMYGACYAVVHDVYIHRRLGWFGDRRIAVFDRLAAAHRVHHLYNAAPYGMLVPIVPADLRARAELTTRNPLAQA